MNNDLTARLVVTLCVTYCGRSSISLNGRLLKSMNRPTGSREKRFASIIWDALRNLDRKPADAEAAGKHTCEDSG
jgi:hypothetical protein